jgi:hypothetical protein
MIEHQNSVPVPLPLVTPAPTVSSLISWDADSEVEINVHDLYWRDFQMWKEVWWDRGRS